LTQDLNSFTVFNITFLATGEWMNNHPENYAEFAKLVLSHCPSPETGPEESKLCCQCPLAPDLEAFSLVQQLLCPAHDETPLSTRLRRARLVEVDKGVDYIKSILRPDWATDPHRVCNFVESNSFSLMHVVADSISSLSPCFGDNRSRFPWLDVSPSLQEDWITFAKEVVRNTDPIYHNTLIHTTFARCSFYGGLEGEIMGHSGYTPLIVLLLKAHVVPWNGRLATRQRKPRFRPILRQWLLILREIGVNLCAYGKAENALLCREDLQVARSIYVNEWVPEVPEYPEGLGGTCSHSHEFYLLGYKYGSKVEDWDVWWNEPTDSFAGEFWDMIENPPTNMPGRWVEDEEATGGRHCPYCTSRYT
jgi:hypothetical protein